MKVILILLIGAVIGYIFLPKNHKVLIEILKYIQLGCTLILIFDMGAMLGSKENFFDELANLGITSFVLCIIPVIFSIILVYIFSKKVIYKHKGEKK